MCKSRYVGKVWARLCLGNVDQSELRALHVSGLKTAKQPEDAGKKTLPVWKINYLYKTLSQEREKSPGIKSRCAKELWFGCVSTGVCTVLQR